MSLDHSLWFSTGAMLKPMSLVLLRVDSGSVLAMYPSPVVHTGVKSFGCNDRMAQPSPIQS